MGLGELTRRDFVKYFGAATGVSYLMETIFHSQQPARQSDQIIYSANLMVGISAEAEKNLRMISDINDKSGRSFKLYNDESGNIRLFGIPSIDDIIMKYGNPIKVELLHDPPFTDDERKSGLHLKYEVFYSRLFEISKEQVEDVLKSLKQDPNVNYAGHVGSDPMQ